MGVLIFLLVLALVAGLPTVLLWRGGFPATGIGAGACIVIGVLATIVWLLTGLSEYPRNEVGHPRRVHVRNESESAVYLVRSAELDPEVWVDEVAPGELTIIRGQYHPRYEDRACTDDAMALAELRPGASLIEVRGHTPRANRPDLTIVAELAECYPKGRNIVVWDGRSAFVDPEARPPLVDPEDEPLAYGWAAAFGALVLGIATDVVTRVVRRRWTVTTGSWPAPQPGTRVPPPSE